MGREWNYVAMCMRGEVGVSSLCCGLGMEGVRLGYAFFFLWNLLAEFCLIQKRNMRFTAS